jgi:thiol-disulfide isomerase/thioredoxin
MSDGIDHDRRHFLGGAAMTIAASRIGALAPALQQLACAARSLPASSELSSLNGATAWLNSPALTADDLRGKVVLVDFCTYTCINWLRSLPYVRAWDARYRDRGLVVIGVHTPEFTFEHDVENVRRALKDLRVDYPIAADNEYAIWRGFGNRYWPAVYVLDAQGRVRFRHFGEGEYGRTEAVVRELLADAGAGGLDPDPVSVDAQGAEVPADWSSLRSPEVYVGYGRTEKFASPGGVVPDERRVYAAPARLAFNHWALSGDWTVGRQPATLNAPGGRIVCRFHARDLHLVMGPAAPGTHARFRVLIDGRPPGAARGADVDDQGNGAAAEQRLYQLIRQPGPIADRQFEMEFLDAPVRAFAFTFG